MGYEIDFLPVGDGGRSGDAIALRYGNLSGRRDEQVVIVVDGGFTDDGEALVDHIRRYYNTDHVDVVVSTHPDQDHVCGLKVVVDKLSVGELWMHRPWMHSQNLSAVRSSRFASPQLSAKVEASLQGQSELEDLAVSKGIPIREPFAGEATADGGFIVLGPTREYYEQLLDELQGEQSLVAAALRVLKRAAAAVHGWLREDHETETLSDNGDTHPQNNTSAICLLAVDERLALLTADAGAPALTPAIERLEAVGFQPGQLNFVQVPHHGSRRNVGPTILNRMLGAKGKRPEDAHAHAFVSAAPEGEPKHPHKKVTNAFLRRGYKVHATKGQAKRHSHNAPDRPGWTTSTPLPHYDQVEDDED